MSDDNLDEYDDDDEGSFDLGLRVEDFIRFLKVYAANSPCPSCGENHFATLSSEGGCYVFKNECRAADGAYLVTPTYAVGCTNCGYLRHHVARVVQDKVAELALQDPGEKGNERN
ncbi:hypothetical protein [uncultured Pseudomonas sp.]|uniref:hypothetical protein n=1 Tax=uncultured Pseudomonas sp. TaxID=114707 RepID=UPI002582E05B|nr:hypothetical protein [uncultured Pseudomonas sp.]